MEGIDTLEKGLELVRGYSSIRKFVEDKDYSPFDYEALRVIHTAYVACSKEQTCIEGKIKQEMKSSEGLLSAEFNRAMKVLANKPKYFNRMNALYFDEIQPLIQSISF